MSAANRFRLGDALFVSWASLLYGLLVSMRPVRDADSLRVYGLLTLVWLALSVWGLCHVAYVLFRAAFPARTRGSRS